MSARIAITETEWTGLSPNPAMLLIDDHRPRSLRRHAARVELADSFCIARAQAGEIGIGADIGKNFPRPRAFIACRRPCHHGNTEHLVQTKSVIRTCVIAPACGAGDGDFGPVEIGNGVKQGLVGNINLRRRLEA